MRLIQAMNDFVVNYPGVVISAFSLLVTLLATSIGLLVRQLSKRLDDYGDTLEEISEDLKNEIKQLHEGYLNKYIDCLREISDLRKEFYQLQRSIPNK